jgi:hypothetical protein
MNGPMSFGPSDHDLDPPEAISSKQQVSAVEALKVLVEEIDASGVYLDRPADAVKFIAQCVSSALTKLIQREATPVETPADSGIPEVEWLAMLARDDKYASVEHCDVPIQDRRSLIAAVKRLTSRGAVKASDDPLAGVRWICGSCTTVNGIDDEQCLGCRKPREEKDARQVKTTTSQTDGEPV